MRALLRKLLPVADLLLVPFVYPAAWLLKAIRRTGVHRLPRSRNALLNVGVFPVRNHYFEPRFDYREPDAGLSRERTLRGIDWNVAGQLEMLERLTFSAELADIPRQKAGELRFHFGNVAFESGDAEYWYQVIRALKPRRIIEVGSGHSTLMAIAATGRNRREDPGYACEHVCIEPYEMPWLEASGVSVVRKRVEELEPPFFSRLQANDILFIDSSHVIRPGGDVLFEYLELLPALNAGVVVHLHDIFSPRDYPAAWLRDEVRLWNEQYLLEAFLSHNRSWTIVGALNYLHRNHYEKLRAVAPYLTPEREPGSFYIRKIA